jgi:hypothetical protein
MDRIDQAIKKFKKKPKQFFLEDEEPDFVYCNCTWAESCAICKKTDVN